MKRILAVVLAVVLCLSMTGCGIFDGFRYIKATNLYKNGNYAEALAIFEQLEDYADSADMAFRCSQFVNYARAEEFFAVGNYADALPLYRGLMLYEDSPMKAVACVYALGDECMESGDYQQAAAWYAELGGYEDAPQKCREARWMWLWTELTENGPVEYLIAEDGREKLEISAEADGRLVITYYVQGNLLGLIFEDRMTLRLVCDDPQTEYEVRCKSVAGTVLWETANGRFDRGGFTGGSQLEMAGFTQTVTKEDSVDPPVSQTEDPAEAVRMHGTMMGAQLAIGQYLPDLLEQTGVEITVKDMGFLSL